MLYDLYISTSTNPRVWFQDAWWHCSNTHTHPFNGHFSGTTRVSRYQKGETNLDFTEARDSEWQWHQLGHMQVCTSLQTDNHACTPPLSFLQAGCPSCCPTNSVKALKGWYRSNLWWKHSAWLFLQNWWRTVVVQWSVVVCHRRQEDYSAAEQLQTELDSSHASIASPLEVYVQCREALHDRVKQLQYLVDLHDKLHMVMMSACC